MFKVILLIFVYSIIASCEGNPLTSSENFLEVIAFRKLGTYRGFTEDGKEYHKTYYLSRYTTASWAESLSFCKSYDLEFLTLETTEEAESYFNLLDTNTFFKSQNTAWFYVDAYAMTPSSRTNWYWTTTGKKVSFPIRWRANAPYGFYCLVLNKPSINDKFYFYDDVCNGTAGAACQKTIILSPQSDK